MRNSPRGHFAIYDRTSGLVRTVVRMTRRTAIQNLRPGEWCIPCDVSQLAPGATVVGRQLVDGGQADAPRDYRQDREAFILEAWPVARQLEAMTEATLGRPEKLAALQEHIAAAKAAFPKPSA